MSAISSWPSLAGFRKAPLLALMRAAIALNAADALCTLLEIDLLGVSEFNPAMRAALGHGVFFFLLAKLLGVWLCVAMLVLAEAKLALWLIDAVLLSIVVIHVAVLGFALYARFSGIGL